MNRLGLAVVFLGILSVLHRATAQDKPTRDTRPPASQPQLDGERSSECAPVPRPDHGSEHEEEHEEHGASAHAHGEHTVEVTATHLLTTHDQVPRFAIGAEAIAVRSGNWSDASIWKTGKVPAAGDKVQIPEHIAVTYDLDSKAKLDCVEVSGQLTFASDRNTAMWTNELMVLPAGALTIQTVDHRAELVFPDSPLRPSDVEQTGKGLLIYGTVTIHGAPLAKTFVRVDGDLRAGGRTIRLQEEVDWVVGSRIVVPDTRQINPLDQADYYHYVPQWEVKTVTAVKGNMLTLDSPLRFDHRGPRNMDGTPTKDFEGKTLAPHVGNLSRNVVVRSENPEGVRGHTQFFANSNVSLKYALFSGLGRTRPGPMEKATNHIGRYAVHCHHLGVKAKGVQGDAQWVIQGNAVVDGLKWGIVVHDSHFGLVKDNVVYDIDGVGIATEDGSESGNLFEHNFVCRINGPPEEPPPFNGYGGTLEDHADLGDGFWFAGPMNSIHNNVVANAYRAAYNVWPEDVPLTPSSRTERLVHSPSSPGRPRVAVNILKEPFDDFVNNEAYGATTAAVHIWSVGNRTDFPSDDPLDVNTLRNTVAWHISGVGIIFYNADSCRVDGWIQRGDVAMINQNIEGGAGSEPSSGEAVNHAGAWARKSWLINADIQGARYGYIQRGRGSTDHVELDNCVLDNAVNLRIVSFAQDPPDGSSDSYYKNILFRDSYSPGSLRAIEMIWDPPSLKEATSPETHTVINFQQIKGLNLDLYYHQQAPGAALNLEGGLPKGRFAPSREVDNDNGEAATLRGKAMGIDGLVFVTSKPEKPLLFCNVSVHQKRPTLFYTIVGEVTNPTVSVTFEGKSKRLSGISGSMDLSYVRARGTLPLKVTCKEVGTLKRNVMLPVKR